MSTFVLPPDYVHATVSFRHTSVPRAQLTTFAAKVNAAPFDQTDAQDLLTAFQLYFKTLYDTEMAISQMVVLVGQDGDPGRFVATNVVQGTRAAVQELPPNVTYLAQKQTALSGRRNRGRMYLPAANEAGVDAGGRLTAGELVIFKAACDGFFNAVNTATAGNVNGMYLLHSEAPTAPTKVVALEAEQVVATQRRRLVRTA